ncbi:hypothetical protein QZH41_008090 [Actinostola sp. cb2023]|nr:hypothetical protein QZH41_008090 [Actinostola sp. cb2023]
MEDEISEGISRLSIGHKEASEQNGNSLKAKYNQLVLDAKEKARQGVLEEALELFNQAYNIHKSSKLEKRIHKLKEYIKEYTSTLQGEEEEEEEEEEDESDDGLVDIGNGYRLAKEINESLYPYQIQGLLWFWKLYNKKQGGILGDDMGLGKTIQVIAFLSGMFDSEHIRSVLIVMPVAVIENWEKEFNTCDHPQCTEMWSLFDFVCEGQLLGSAKTFKTEFDNPIVRARERDASAYEKRIGNEMAKSLRKLIEPHFLRRTKAEVLNKKNSQADSPDGCVGSAGDDHGDDGIVAASVDSGSGDDHGDDGIVAASVDSGSGDDNAGGCNGGGTAFLLL